MGFAMITRNLGSLENRKVQDFLGLGCQFLVDFWNFAKSEIFRGIAENSGKLQGCARRRIFESPGNRLKNPKFVVFGENVKTCKVPKILGR